MSKLGLEDFLTIILVSMRISMINIFNKRFLFMEFGESMMTRYPFRITVIF